MPSIGKPDSLQGGNRFSNIKIKRRSDPQPQTGNGVAPNGKDLDKKILEKGNNKEMSNYTQKEKKDLFLELLYQSLLSQKNNILEKGNNKEVSNITGKSTKNDNTENQYSLWLQIIIYSK